MAASRPPRRRAPLGSIVCRPCEPVRARHLCLAPPRRMRYAPGVPSTSFETDPSRYRHWQLDIRDGIAVLGLKVDEDGGVAPGYALKLNSYDLGVDIELADAIQRLRLSHPEVHALVITSLRERMFSAGANISM